MRSALLAGLAALLVSLSLPAAASCLDDMNALSARAKIEPNKQIKGAVSKYLVEAEKARRASETDCHNNVVRGWKVIHGETPVGAKPLPYLAPPKQQPNTPTETYDETLRRQQQPVTLGPGITH